MMFKSIISPRNANTREHTPLNNKRYSMGKEPSADYRIKTIEDQLIEVKTRLLELDNNSRTQFSLI